MSVIILVKKCNLRYKISQNLEEETGSARKILLKELNENEGAQR